MTDLHYWSIKTLSEKFRRRELSPVDVVDAMLERIARLDGKYHAYITVMADQARARARVAEQEIAQGMWRGPLHGVPLAIKDLFDTSDAPTTSGMSIYRNHVPENDATVVDRLYRAGAVVLGKLNLTEGAYTNNNPAFPTPINPWGDNLWAGASSHGSGVAVAAGLAYGALSTDTGGSIRFPSAVNGVTGIKPTWGRVSRHGAFTLADSFDHVGPFARSAEDAGSILTAIAGPDDKDQTSLRADVPDYGVAALGGVRGLRIGIDRHYIGSNTHPEVLRAVEDAIAAFQSLGARIKPVVFPTPYDAIRAWMDICCAETAQYHAQTYPSRASEYQAGLAQLIEHGREISGMQVANAWIRRLTFTRQVEAAIEDVDLMLIPTMTTPTPTLSEVEAYGAEDEVLLNMMRYTSPFDVSGNPTIVLPAGLDRSGAPVSIQLVGKHLGEGLLCAAGHSYQCASAHHLLHPIA